MGPHSCKGGDPNIPQDDQQSRRMWLNIPKIGNPKTAGCGPICPQHVALHSRRMGSNIPHETPHILQEASLPCKKGPTSRNMAEAQKSTGRPQYTANWVSTNPRGANVPET